MRATLASLTVWALLVIANLAVAADQASSPASSAPAASAASASSPRYTFSWPLNGANPAPRGGSTRGPEVALDTDESALWRALHEPGLTAFERDRRAILAIVSDYRVTFDFLEIATFTPGTPRDRPYQSWGTERIYLDRDDGTSISLVHILEMRVIEKDGSVSAPLVQKHWREDWQYEPRQIVEFKGYDRWGQRELSASERRGRWSQTVEQTDESPHYASLGHWEHSAALSTWISGDTWRPLPRRESQRKDYQVLLGTNRVTVTANGWLQEENNLKAVLTPQRELDASRPYLAREYGVAHYERLRDADFAAATQYYERTRTFWDQVQAAWFDLFRRNAQITLHEPADPDSGPYAKLFDYADQLAAGQGRPGHESELIQAALREVVTPIAEKTSRLSSDVQAVAGQPPSRELP
jgi:hypothetical protein